MRDYTRRPSPWGTYGYIVRRTIDGVLHHRSFPARADRDPPEVIKAARQAAEAYERELLQSMEQARQRRRRERPPKGLSPVSGIQPFLSETVRGDTRYEYRAWAARKYRNGRTIQQRFWVSDHGDRGAWEEACRFLADLEDIDPLPLIAKYPGVEIWDQVRAQRELNRDRQSA